MAEDRVAHFKKTAAIAAVERVKSGMVVGLGTGSTTAYFVEELGERLRLGRLGGVVGIPTSDETAAVAINAGIPISEVGRSPLTLAVDGADEISPSLALTKGGGGALLREKIVAAAAPEFIVIADDSKLVEVLGSTCDIPIEVAVFGARGTMDHLRRFGHPTLRTVGSEAFISDNGNYIVDLQVEPIGHPARFNELLCSLPGVLETGIFPGMATEALIGGLAGVRSVKPL